MRMSSLFSQTLRDVPAEAETAGHQLLLRAGFIRQLASGIFTYLPLAKRSLTKIENIMREEMEAIGGQEITMPIVQPAEIWKETGRWHQIGSEMGRFKDKNNRDMVLAMTHEEVVADLVRKEIKTYRQLPALIYHIQTKWRDDPRPRAGLIRVREFTMKDSYSLDRDSDGLDRQYRAHYQAYFNIFHRCALPVIAVKSDVGVMGGQIAHEFMYISTVGEDTILICDKCGYSANRQVASFRKSPAPIEDSKPIDKVSTPDIRTIEALAEFLQIPRSKTAKAVFIIAEFSGQEDREKFVFVVVRGDMEVNETKLANTLKAKELRPANETEIQAVGAVAGYASPIDLKDVLVVVDDIVPESPNLAAGANETGYHLLNVNYGRDYTADIVADITAAQEGDACPECKNPMRSVRGVETGNIFKLGARYSNDMGCRFLDKDGKEKPVIMGSYGIGSGRLLGCIAEEYRDEKGLMWPITVAPYHVHFLVLQGKDKNRDIQSGANRFCQELEAAGVEVLFDDRHESPGVKFTDADLIGLPIRLTLSSRSLKNDSVEIKFRDSKDPFLVPLNQAISRIKSEIASLLEVISKKAIPVQFKE